MLCVCESNYEEQPMNSTTSSVGMNFNAIHASATSASYFPYDQNWKPEFRWNHLDPSSDIGFYGSFTPSAPSYYPMMQTNNLAATHTRFMSHFQPDFGQLYISPNELNLASSYVSGSTSILENLSEMRRISQESVLPSPDSTSQRKPSTSYRRHRGCNCSNCTGGGKRIHKCERCAKEYAKISHLKSHVIRAHFNLRPFVCSFPNCKRAFSRTDELQRHLRTHTGEKNYECPKCEKRFGRSDHMSKHMKTHSKYDFALKIEEPLSEERISTPDSVSQ